LFLSFSYSSPALPIGAHPLDEKYYDAELIKCKDGSKLFPRDRLNDDFCDCADGSDEPGTSACPYGKFYCRNVGSVPKFVFSSRVNDRICDCCDGSDEYDGSAICPNICVMGGNAASYQITSHEKDEDFVDDKADDSPSNLGGSISIVILLQGGLIITVLIFLVFRRRRRQRKTGR
ncbi:hypothetical protein M569_11594, partial [Genlisea aurea]